MKCSVCKTSYPCPHWWEILEKTFYPRKQQTTQAPSNCETEMHWYDEAKIERDERRKLWLEMLSKRSSNEIEK